MNISHWGFIELVDMPFGPHRAVALSLLVEYFNAQIWLGWGI